MAGTRGHRPGHRAPPATPERNTDQEATATQMWGFMTSFESADTYSRPDGGDLDARVLDAVGVRAPAPLVLLCSSDYAHPSSCVCELAGGQSLSKSVGTGKCLDLHTYDPGYDSWLWECNGTGPQQFDVAL